MTEEVREFAALVTRPIEKGCMVLILGDQFVEDDMPYVMNELRRVAGHDKFVIVEVGPGKSIGVHGPEDLKEALRQLAKEATNDTSKENSSASGANDLGTGHGVPPL